MSKNVCITRDIDGVERVEKIVSLNPDRYEWKDFYEMLLEYSGYCYRAGYSRTEDNYKTFKEWLDTEI